MGEGRELDEAFVTLATNDTYALGCLVLGSSLRRVGTTRQLVVMVTSGVSQSMRQQLSELFHHLIPVDVLDSSDTCNLELLGRPDLSVTFTKFHCWRLTQFKKCVFMDADTMVIQNIDDLFDREELSAAPDAGWPDCFNSGVFVYVPSEETYRNLLSFAVTSGSFDGGDQGLLNLYFKTWATEDIGKHLPFTYNVVSQAFYSYLPAFKQFFDNIKVVHFIGAVKPWHHAYNTSTGTVTQLPGTGHSQEFLQLWWNIFMESVQPNLDPQLRTAVRLEHAPAPFPRTEGSFPRSAHGMYPHSPSELDHHHHQHDDHGHSRLRVEPTTSYNVLYPYVPPDVDENSQSSPPASQNHTSSKVVDVPIVYREYRTLESHYPEEPLSVVNPEMPPQEHYSARETFSGHGFQRSADGDRITSSPSAETGDKQLSETSFENSTSAHSSATDHNVGEQGTRVEEEVEGDASTEESKDLNQNSIKGGIVGDLANISLTGDGAYQMKDDRERKLQWEQGQADYMGVDRFDNIKARLDEKMSHPEPSTSGSKLTTESQPQPEPEPPK